MARLAISSQGPSTSSVTRVELIKLAKVPENPIEWVVALRHTEIEMLTRLASEDQELFSKLPPVHEALLEHHISLLRPAFISIYRSKRPGPARDETLSKQAAQFYDAVVQEIAKLEKARTDPPAPEPSPSRAYPAPATPSASTAPAKPSTPTTPATPPIPTTTPTKASAPATQTARPQKRAPIIKARSGPEKFLHYVWVFVAATAATIFRSLIVPALAIASVAGVAAFATFLAVEFQTVWPALVALDFRFLATPEFLAVLFPILGAATLFEAMRSLYQYLIRGKRFIVGQLARRVPKDAKLAAMPKTSARIYHRVLQWSALVAVVSEIVFQVLAAAVITWCAVSGWPHLQLFQDAAAPPLQDIIVFWTDRLLAFVDAIEIANIQLSPLVIAAGAQYFSGVILAVQILILAMLLRMLQATFFLTPGDISKDWAAATA